MKQMEYFEQVQQAIGGTPLVRLARLEAQEGLCARVSAKLEMLNPGGSVKDRVARAMIDDAEARGVLQAGGTVIEPTSGNTGIGLALAGVPRGYRVVLTMPETMSAERRKTLAALGAQLVLTPGAEGMAGAIKRAEALQRETPGSFIPGQFSNPANPRAHYETTGPEIWQAANGQVDIFVAGVGTGGTISGTGRYLREKNAEVRLVAVEPAASPVLSGGVAGPHPLQGIGAGFVPQNLDVKLIDEVMPVTGEDAFAAARELATTEGVFAGISSGAALWAALRLARRGENAGKHIVALLPDTGDRYLSTALYGD